MSQRQSFTMCFCCILAVKQLLFLIKPQGPMPKGVHEKYNLNRKLGLGAHSFFAPVSLQKLSIC